MSNPPDKYFDWWIKNHQSIITRMIDGSGKKIKYYGGFALNVAMGGDMLPEVGWILLSYYKRGLVTTGQPASDIDAKILDVPYHEEGRTVRTFLERGSAGRTVATFADEEDEGGAKKTAIAVSKVSAAENYILQSYDAGTAPFEYIIGYIKPYPSNKRIHFQLVIYGLFRTEEGWGAQGLSELTPVSDKAPADAPTFINTDLSTLQGQFEALSTFLQTAKNAGNTRYNSARHAKTLRRIEAIVKRLSDTRAAEANRASEGGARRCTRRIRRN